MLELYNINSLLVFNSIGKVRYKVIKLNLKIYKKAN